MDNKTLADQFYSRFKNFFLNEVGGETINWYGDAHATIAEMATKYNVPFDAAVGVVAVTSPMTVWERNLIVAEQLIARFVESPEKPDWRQVIIQGTDANKDKAWSVLVDGPQVGVNIRGIKVIAFYHNLLNPTGEKYVTIDRHMIRIAVGDYVGDTDLKSIPKNYVPLMFDAFIKLARDLGELPLAMQAAMWVGQRG